MKLRTKLLVLVPLALASIGACADDVSESERVGHSRSAVASVVTFDNPAPPGNADTALGTFGGIVWGSGWFWSGPYGSNTTNHAYFSSDVTSRSFSFASGQRRLTSVRVYALEPGTLTLTDNAGQTRSLVLGVGAPVTLSTNWTQASSSVTVSFSAGWDFGLDDIATDDAIASDAGTGGTGGSGGNDASVADSGNDSGGGTLTVATFDSPSPPGSADSLLGAFSGIDFGNQWRWSGAYGADPTNHVYFASDTGSRSFTFVGGARVLESVRAYVLTAGTLTLADSNGQTRSQALVPGSLSTITTGFGQASTSITVSFTAGWALGLDDIASRGAGAPVDAGSGGSGGTGGSGGSGGTTASSSLRFVQNAAGNYEYARHTAIPSGFGTGEFTLEVRLTLANGPSGSCSGGAAQLTNWCTANNAPYSSSGWWYEGNFLLDGHNNNSNFENGTFSLQFYGGGRIRWLFGDGAVNQPGRVWSVPGTANAASSAPSLLDSQPHLVTLVRRLPGATGSTLELWIDGTLVASQVTTARPNMRQWWDSWPGFPTGQSGWFWGAEKQAAIGLLSQYEDFKGLLHEVRFWSVARSASAIAASPSTPVSPGAPGLVGRFDFNEGSGSQACDSVSAACMTLHNATASIWAP